jgi:hypothetical protein
MTVQLRDARERGDDKKDEMIYKIKRKIPELNSQTLTLMNEIEDPKYLDINSDMQIRIKEVNKMGEIVKGLISKKDSIQEY